MVYVNNNCVLAEINGRDHSNANENVVLQYLFAHEKKTECFLRPLSCHVDGVRERNSHTRFDLGG